MFRTLIIFTLFTTGISCHSCAQPATDGKGKIKENETLRYIKRDDPWKQFLPLTAVHTLFDQEGDTISSRVVFKFSETDEMKPAIFTVTEERLYLYKAPSTREKPAMYLISGETYEVLDHSKSGWLKIRYANPKYGNSEYGYITVTAAASDELDFYRSAIKENQGLELRTEKSEATGDVYGALSYVKPGNPETPLTQLKVDRIYILYRAIQSLETYAVWQLASQPQTFETPTHGEVVLYENNSLIWKHHMYLLADDAVDRGAFLPNDLPAGEYEYRMLMVIDNKLTLISNAATLEYPLPKLRWD